MSRFRKKFSGLRANAGQIILRSSAELRAVVVQCCLVLILFPLAGNSFVLLDLTSLQQDDESLARVSASIQENTYANSCKSLPLFVGVLENKINYVFLHPLGQVLTIEFRSSWFFNPGGAQNRAPPSHRIYT